MEEIPYEIYQIIAEAIENPADYKNFFFAFNFIYKYLDINKIKSKFIHVVSVENKTNEFIELDGKKYKHGITIKEEGKDKKISRHYKGLKHGITEIRSNGKLIFKAKYYLGKRHGKFKVTDNYFTYLSRFYLGKLHGISKCYQMLSDIKFLKEDYYHDLGFEKIHRIYDVFGNKIYEVNYENKEIHKFHDIITEDIHVYIIIKSKEYTSKLHVHPLNHIKTIMINFNNTSGGNSTKFYFGNILMQKNYRVCDYMVPNKNVYVVLAL